MPSTARKTDTVKILLDLKPALDGYAGIPQETRLLFRGLRSDADYTVEGLIQHGGRRLKRAIAPGRTLSTARRINHLSRVVVSLYEKPYNSFMDGIAEATSKYRSMTVLQLRKNLGMPINTQLFDPALFEDFIWRTFFNKTLKSSDMGLITSGGFRILDYSRNMLHHVGLRDVKFSTAPKYITVNTKGFDFFVAQTPFPGRVTNGSRMVIRYHDAVPILMPHTISDKAFHQASHFYALQDNVRSGAWFSCVSAATRSDLLKIFPEAEKRSVVIPNIVSDEYFPEDSHPNLVYQVIRNRQTKGSDPKLKLQQFRGRVGSTEPAMQYLLMVSTIEPRKNHLMLLEAWERLKYTTMPNLKLVVVGSLGWDHGPIVEAFKPWVEGGDLHHLTNVPAAELRVLYRHAAATVCPSVAEGFDYSGVEAMRCGGVVLASDIPVHREVYGDAAAYFDPYSSEDASQVVQRVLGVDAEPVRQRLRDAAVTIAARYSQETIIPKWNEFFRTAANTLAGG
jgi:glycosyltransferase involved in cell wall biosynthesis